MFYNFDIFVKTLFKTKHLTFWNKLCSWHSTYVHMHALCMFYVCLWICTWNCTAYLFNLTVHQQPSRAPSSIFFDVILLVGFNQLQVIYQKYRGKGVIAHSGFGRWKVPCVLSACCNHYALLSRIKKWSDYQPSVRSI